MRTLENLPAALDALRESVERHVTIERVRRYLAALADTPAPSSAAAILRVPVLRRLLADDGVLDDNRLHLRGDFERSGSPVILTGNPDAAKPLWYFAHLDTISYLVQPAESGDLVPLVPFCAHMIGDGTRAARAYRYSLERNIVEAIAEGELVSRNGIPLFHSASGAQSLRPGDRVGIVSPFEEAPGTGLFTGSLDNAGGVAALAVAAPVLARAGIEAMLAFPDEEEGPVAPGNQMIGRGSSRIVARLPPPDLAIIADVQQAGGESDADVRGGIANTTRLGGGAVLAEFSSFARGAVTPPDLYALARHTAGLLGDRGVRVQESNNAYSSRSDDVSVMLRTPNILLLGFAGFNRHFDHGAPRAHLGDIVDLTKALIYMAALQPCFMARRQALLGEVS